MMKKHTPGPWEAVRQASCSNFWWIAGSAMNGKKLAQMCHSYEDQKEANAKLIAAAPDLLEALEGIVSIGKRDMSNPKYDACFEQARAAIAKAEGVDE